MADKRKYEEPELTQFGTIGSITQGAGGSFADSPYLDDGPADGGPIGDGPADHP